MLALCSPLLPLQMLTPTAVTEKAEVTTGWGGGGNGWVGGRGGHPYNLRLPTEGLRQGHGLRPLGRRPDLKADA